MISTPLVCTYKAYPSPVCKAGRQKLNNTAPTAARMRKPSGAELHAYHNGRRRSEGICRLLRHDCKLCCATTTTYSRTCSQHYGYAGTHTVTAHMQQWVDTGRSMTNISSTSYRLQKTTGTVHSTYVSHRHVLRPHHKIAGPTCTEKAADTGPTKLCFATHVCKISQSPSKGIGHIDAQACWLQ